MSVRWSVAAVLLAAIITLALVFAFVQPSTAVERIADGVSAGGVDVSGLTLAEATTKLRGTQATRVARDSVTVRAADLTWRLEASSASVRLLVSRTARRALLAGRRAAGRPVDVALAVTYSKDAVNDFTKRIDRRLRRKPRDARLKISLTSVDVVRHKSGRDVSQVGYYTAFGYWKLACIIEGVYARYRGGAMGAEATGFEGFGQQVVTLADTAARALGVAPR